jgi:hypothetical protein
MRNFASIRRGLFAVLGLALTFSIAQPAAAAIIGGSVIVQNTGEVFATYRGNSAQYSNDLYLESPDGPFRTSFIFNNKTSPLGVPVSLGSFTAGTELIFHLHVNDTGDDWYSGPAIRNSDGHAHTRITDAWSPTESLVEFEDLRDTPEGNGGFNDLAFSFSNTGSVVPEPGTYALFAAGIVMLLGLQRSRRAL